MRIVPFCIFKWRRAAPARSFFTLNYRVRARGVQMHALQPLAPRARTRANALAFVAAHQAMPPRVSIFSRGGRADAWAQHTAPAGVSAGKRIAVVAGVMMAADAADAAGAPTAAAAAPTAADGDR